MDVTIIIGTRNRAESLASTLHSLSGLVPVPDHWEVIVANNGSTDATSAVVASFAARLPVCEVHEPRVGRSHALNAALRHATGSLLVFTDDDITFASGWLDAYWRGQGEFPDAGVFAGPIDPVFPPEAPAWFPEAFARYAGSMLYGRLDLGPRSKVVDRDPFGGNMAVRRSLFHNRSFHSGFGLVDGKAVSRLGEETLLSFELRRAGVSVAYVAGARVRHHIRPEQVEERWIADRARAYGATAAALDLLGVAGTAIKVRSTTTRWLRYAATMNAVRWLPLRQRLRTSVEYYKLQGYRAERQRGR